MVVVPGRVCYHVMIPRMIRIVVSNYSSHVIALRARRELSDCPQRGDRVFEQKVRRDHDI
jgi:hypothetical protein